MNPQSPILPPGLRLESGASRPDLYHKLYHDKNHELCDWQPWQLGAGLFDAMRHLMEIQELAAFQTMVVRESDDEVVAVGECGPFYCPKLAAYQSGDTDLLQWATSLPDGGWHTIMARVIRQAKARKGESITLNTAAFPEEGIDEQIISRARNAPNALSGICVQVTEEYHGCGVADALLLNFKALATQHNFKALVVPLRPTRKVEFPFVSYEDYFTWTQGNPHQPGFTWATKDDLNHSQGLPFDPWLRKHARMGAKFVKPAPQSLIVEAAAAEWQDWFGSLVSLDVHVDEHGEKHVLGEKLDGSRYDDWFSSPMRWDEVKKVARYIEVDMWVLHPLYTA